MWRRFIVYMLLISWANMAEAFDSDLWPGEGMPRFAAKAEFLTLHKAPSQSSPVAVKYRAVVAQEIRYDQTRLRTLRAGKVTAKVAGAWSGRRFGPISHLSKAQYYSQAAAWTDYAYSAGETFEYLQNRAEGACLIKYRGDVLEIDWCPWLDRNTTSDFEMSVAPEIQWWIRVIGDNKHPMGWLLVEENVVTFLPRQF